MDSKDAPQQIRSGILRFQEFHRGPQKIPSRNQPIQSNRFGINNSSDQSWSQWRVQNLPIGQNECLVLPIKHSPDTNKGIFYIRFRGVSPSAVAPAFPTAIKIQPSYNALSIQKIGLRQGQADFTAIL